MAKITIEFDSTDDNANDILAAFVGGSGEVQVTGMQATTSVEAEDNGSSMTDEEAEEAAALVKKAETAAKRKAAREKKAADEAKAAADASDKAEADKMDAEAAGLGDDDGDEPQVTREDVRAALKKYAKLEGQPAAVAILKDNGASTMGELEEDKFQDVIDAASVG